MKKQKKFEEPKDRKTPTQRAPNPPSGEADSDDLEDRDERDERDDMRREPETPTGTDPRRRGSHH